MFGQPVQFNFTGKDTLNSLPSAVVSILLIVLTLVYCLDQGSKCLLMTNNSVSEYVVNHYFSDDYEINLNKVGQKFAWGMINKEFQSFDDPDFVQWQVSIYESETRVRTKTNLGFHRCNETDYKEFYAPNSKFKTNFELVKKSNAFYCFDDGQNLTIQGDYSKANHNILTIEFLPCDQNSSESNNCSSDLHAIQEYLFRTELVIIYNTERFDSSILNTNKSIIQESFYHVIWYSPKSPEWTAVNIQTNQLQDEIDYFQLLGGTQFKDFYQPTFQMPRASSMVFFPESYKFISFEFNINSDLYVKSRQAYSVMNLLGDVGGLYSALEFIAAMSVLSYNLKYHDQQVVKNLFNKRKSKTEDKKSQPEHKLNTFENIRSTMQKDFKSRISMSEQSIMKSFRNLFCPKEKYKKSQRMYEKGKNRFQRELDIANLIRSQRISHQVMRIFLSQSQTRIVQRISESILTDKETSFSESSGSEGTKNLANRGILTERWYHPYGQSQKCKSKDLKKLQQQGEFDIKLMKRYMEQNKLFYSISQNAINFQQESKLDKEKVQEIDIKQSPQIQSPSTLSQPPKKLETIQEEKRLNDQTMQLPIGLNEIALSGQSMRSEYSKTPMLEINQLCDENIDSARAVSLLGNLCYQKKFFCTLPQKPIMSQILQTDNSMHYPSYLNHAYEMVYNPQINTVLRQKGKFNDWQPNPLENYQKSLHWGTYQSQTSDKQEFTIYGEMTTDKKPYGKGVMVFKNQKALKEGYFDENSKMQGKGRIIDQKAWCYEGVFQNDRFHGSGILQWQDGSKVECNFVQNQPIKISFKTQNGQTQNKTITLQEFQSLLKNKTQGLKDIEQKSKDC